MLRIQRNYFITFLILLGIEVCIAAFISDGFIRHYFGDFLVVILIYCLIMSIFKLRSIIAAWIVLLISTIIEIGQYFRILDLLGLQGNRLANLVFGNTFSIGDLIAYFLGIIAVVILESVSKRPSR